MMRDHLRYGLSIDQLGEVRLQDQADAMVLHVDHVHRDSGRVLQALAHRTLIPPRGPDGESLARLRLLPEADGFTLIVEYTLPPRIEHYALRFRQLACAASGRTPASCPVTLLSFRHERRDAAHAVNSGFVADYPAGQMRWLGAPGRTIGPHLPPVRLLSEPAPTLDELDDIFSYSPRLALPKSH